MIRRSVFSALAALLLASTAGAVPVVVRFEAAGSDAAAITATRDAFRAAMGVAARGLQTARSAACGVRSTGTGRLI